MGAAGGALIGGGVTAAAGGAMLASAVMVGAGTGMLGSQVGYTVAAGKAYNTKEMLTSTLIGGVSGAFSGYVGSVKSGLTAVLWKAGSAAWAGSMQHATTELYNDRAPTIRGTLQSAFFGVGSYAFGETILGGIQIFGNSPYRMDRLIGEAVDDTLRSITVESLSNAATPRRVSVNPSQV